MADAWDYSRALQELWDRSSYERGLIGDPFGDEERARRGMRRMRELLRHLDNPHLRVPAVHVAGSKGKGSTANFIATAALEAGLQVGFYSSPHLHRFPERIALNGLPLSDAAFAEAAEVVAEAALACEASAPELGSVTTFEFITAMAFNTFAAACELAVIEVGLGGLYDATNVLTPRVSVITRIDLEHTAVLGPTHGDIAFQKAGIIKPGVPCVSSPQVPEAADAIVRAAKDAGSSLQMGGRDWTWSGTWEAFNAAGPWGDWTDLTLGIPGGHQIENACTALAALHLVNASGLRIPEGAMRRGLAGARWAGRFERLSISGRDVVLDGAHTPAAAAALIDAWRAVFGAQSATVILGMGADKDAASFLAMIEPIVALLIATRADSPRAADPAEIADAASARGISVIIAPTVSDAVARAAGTTPSPLLITGSLFVAGEAREAFGLAEPDMVWRLLNESRRSHPATP